MDEWIIKSDKETRLVFNSRQFNSEGWLETYSVTAKARDFNATVLVQNSPYGRSPVHLFSAVASKYSGWANKITWRAIEGEYSLSATCDKLGHVTLLAEIDNFNVPPCWGASLSLALELG